MAAIERKINGTFAPVPGGYAQQINEQTTLFVPEFTVARYDTETGELFGHAPDYEALEAAKSPAVHADKPGEYSYCYEMEKAPTGCDFSASLSYYGKHYYLRPLRDDLPQLRGRGISYDEQRSTYTVTRRAYDKLKEPSRAAPDKATRPQATRPNHKPQKGADTMRKEPFPIKNILDSLREDVQNGTITLSQAAEELHRAGWSNYIDEDTARRLLKL